MRFLVFSMKCSGTAHTIIGSGVLKPPKKSTCAKLITVSLKCDRQSETSRLESEVLVDVNQKANKV